MTREVFHGGDHATALHAEGVSGSLLPYVLRVLAEATNTDDRVVGVRVDIGDGGKVGMDAHTQTLVGHLLSHLVDQLVVGDGAECHLVRIGHHVVDAHGDTPFTVDADHQRGLSQALPGVGLFHLGHRIGFEEAYASDVIPFDVVAHCRFEGLAWVVGPHADQLAHTLFQGEAVIYRVHPAGLGILCKKPPTHHQQPNGHQGKMSSLHNFYLLSLIFYLLTP